MIGRALFLPGGLSCAPQKIPNLRRGRLRTSPAPYELPGGTRKFRTDDRFGIFPHFVGADDPVRPQKILFFQKILANS